MTYEKIDFHFTLISFFIIKYNFFKSCAELIILQLIAMTEHLYTFIYIFID